MKLLCAVLSVAAFSLIAWSQEPPQPGNPSVASRLKSSPFKEYVGRWSAAFGGRTWLNLRLELREDGVSGSLLHARSFELNDNGELKSVSEEQSSGDVTAAEITPDGLLLTVKDSDSQETDRYMMRIVTKERDNAELKMVAASMPPGMPKPKPWRLVKSGIAMTNRVADPR